MIAAEDAFRRAMAEAGVVTNAPIVVREKITRFDVETEGNKPGRKSGWYKFFDGEVPAGAFGCWKLGINEKWCSKSWQSLSPKERDRVKKRYRETKILWKNEQEKIHAEARERAKKIWENASEVHSHPYLENKGVKAYGIRENRGSLILPVRNSEGTLTSLQFIKPDGKKKFLSGGKKQGCYLPIGKSNGRIIIGEGYATVASIHKATGDAGAVAFDAGNLKPVAEALHRKFSKCEIVIAADDDAYTEGNPGLTKAKEAALAVGGKVAVPEFKDTSSKPTDFNDLCQLESAEKVKKLLEKAREPEESISVVLGKLAALSPIEYDQCRKAEAKRLGIREATLNAEVSKLRPKSATTNNDSGQHVIFEEAEPWTEFVDGAALLSDLTSTIALYCILPEGAAVAIALWIFHTYCHGAAMISPILAITSPEKRCGKTILLGLLQFLVCKPLSAANITTAALFRATELWKPALLIDEGDTFLRHNKELRGVLNSGHRRESAFVIRTVGDDHEPKQFQTWAPKAIALINKMPDTLMDRSIEIPMRRRLPGERVNRLRRAGAKFLEHRRKLARWTIDNLEDLKDAEPKIPNNLNDRAADNWEALLAIAERAGGDWPQKALFAIRALNPAEGEDESLREMLLGDIKNLFENQKVDRIASKALAIALGKMEERPWPEFRNGKEITPRQIAKILKPFTVTPKLIRDGGEVFRGYIKKDFADAFSRYLPNLSVTTLQTNAEAGLRDITSVTKENAVTDKKRPDPTVYAGCNTVTDGNRDGWEEVI